MFTLDTLFEREYLLKIKDKEKLRYLLDSTVSKGEGKKMAEHYFVYPAENIEALKKQKVGLISDNEARPIFEKIINFIKINKLDDNDDVWIIQLGSSSGKDLEFFYNYFPKLNYISTDINDEILNFQKKKISYPKFKFFKCHAENINKCINYFQLENKKIVLFSIGSLQYVAPFFLKDFFLNIKGIKKINLFINEPVNLQFIDSSKDLSQYRGKCSFSHRYKNYAEEFEIIEEKIIRPYASDDLSHKNTGHYYLHLKT